MAHTSIITAEGNLVIPPEIRDQLGLAAGTVVEWETDGNRAVVRKQSPFDDLRRNLFPEGPPEAHSLEELKQGIEDYVAEKHARR